MKEFSQRLEPKFEILELLGEGATSAAYRARRRQDGLECVVKIFLKPLAEDEGLARFDRECRALAQLQHPNIVKLIEWGDIDGLAYLALEYHDCETLNVYAKRVRPSWQRAVLLIAKLARALGYTHDLGMVHRDIKPQNTLILRDGTPLLIDFGLVRSGCMSTFKTATGTVLGTPIYMAPELFGTAEATPSSDLYSLGVMLYQLLGSKNPFPTQLKDMLASKFKRPPPLHGSVPKALNMLVLQLLEPNVKNRFAGSGHDLAMALENLTQIGDTQKQVETVPAQAPPKEEKAQISWKYALLAVVILAIVGFFSYAKSQENSLSVAWSYSQLGSYAKRHGSLNHLAPKKACPLEQRGRLLKATLYLQQNAGVKALQELEPILKGARFGIVGNPLALLEMVTKAIKLADEAAAEDYDHLLYLACHGKRAKKLSSQLRGYLEEYLQGLPLRRKVVLKLRFLVSVQKDMQLTAGQFLKAAREALNGVKSLKEHSPVHGKTNFSSYRSDAVRMLVPWCALVTSQSSNWQTSELPWLTLLKEIKRLKEFPQMSLFAPMAFQHLSKVPFPLSLSDRLMSFYERLLRLRDSNAQLRHGARLGWLRAYGCEELRKGESPLSPAEFYEKSMRLQLTHRLSDHNVLPVEHFYHWQLYESSLLNKSDKLAKKHISPLFSRAFAFPGTVNTLLQITLHNTLHCDDEFSLTAINECLQLLKSCKLPERRALVKGAIYAITAAKLGVVPKGQITKEMFAKWGAEAKKFSWFDENLIPTGFSDEAVGTLLFLAMPNEVTKELKKQQRDAMEGVLSLWRVKKMGLPWLPRFLPILWTGGLWSHRGLVTSMADWLTEPVSEEERLFVVSTLCYLPEKQFFDYTKGLPKLRKNVPLERLAFFDRELFVNSFRTRTVSKEVFGTEVRIAEATLALMRAWSKDGKIVEENVMSWFNLALLLSELVEFLDCVSAEGLRKGDAGFTLEGKAPVVCFFGLDMVPLVDLVPEKLLPKTFAHFLKIHKARIHHYARRQSGIARKLLSSIKEAELSEAHRWFYYLWWLRLSVDGDGKRAQNLALRKKAESFDYADTSEVYRVSLKAAMRP